MVSLSMVLAVFFAQGVVAEAPDPGACSLSMPCAIFGRCEPVTARDGEATCGFTDDASCTRSRACVEFGACRLHSYMACTGEDPAACAPDKAPCRLFGNCKFNRPSSVSCRANAKGCAESAECRELGLCKATRGEAGGNELVCRPSKRGCAESWGCKHKGGCLARGSVKDLACQVDQASCERSEYCQEFGSCSALPSGLFCTYLTDADCRRSRECSIFGHCDRRYRPCPPEDPNCGPVRCAPARERPCEGAQVCERYGACKAVNERCAIHEAPAPCELVPIRVAAAKVGSVHPGLPGLAFPASGLIDGDGRTGWVPAPGEPLPQRITLELERPTRIDGIRLYNGLGAIHPDEGQLAFAFGKVRGYAVWIGGRVHEVFHARADDPGRFPSVETSVVEVEIFHGIGGRRFDSYGIREIELLACKAPAP